MKNKLLRIEGKICKLAKKIDASSAMIPTLNKVVGDATPFIMENEEGLHYIISERGKMREHYILKTEKDLLYIVFRNITISLAVSYAARHSKEGVDYRRMMWKRQLELMGKIDKDYIQKLRDKIRDVLLKHPYSDNL